MNHGWFYPPPSSRQLPPGQPQIGRRRRSHVQMGSSIQAQRLVMAHTSEQLIGHTSGIFIGVAEVDPAGRGSTASRCGCCGHRTFLI